MQIRMRRESCTPEGTAIDGAVEEELDEEGEGLARERKLWKWVGVKFQFMEVANRKIMSIFIYILCLWYK